MCWTIENLILILFWFSRLLSHLFDFKFWNHMLRVNSTSPWSASINQFSKIDLVKSILIIQIILFSLPYFVHIYNPTFLPTCHNFISIKTSDITYWNVWFNLEQTFSNIQHWHQIWNICGTEMVTLSTNCSSNCDYCLNQRYKLRPIILPDRQQLTYSHYNYPHLTNYCLYCRAF